MATAYTEFDTTPATIVADIKAKILLSADWTNATGQVVKAVGTDGQELVVDLVGAAATNLLMGLTAYRSHNGVSGTDAAPIRYLHWHRTGNASAATDQVHVVVSAGPDHLYISVEGPRAGETNADSSLLGSHKSVFVLASILPYYASDTVETVALIGAPSSTATVSSGEVVYVGRNAANTLSWVSALLLTVQWCATQASGSALRQGNMVDIDGNVVLRPWVVSELSGGDRGRLRDIYYAGIQWGLRIASSDPVLAHGMKASYGGDTFTLLESGKSTVASNYASYGFGYVLAGAAGTGYAPLVAVPSA